jgi:hypothetical protein
MATKAKAKRKTKRPRSDSKKRSGIDHAFGLWADRKIDGLEYQRKLRDEWKR